MFDFLTHLFDSSGFPPRWHCGSWTAGHGWLHVLSDLGVWSAYVAIPCVLGFFVLRRRDIPFRAIFWLFGAFILACGTTHLMEAAIFWWPAYRLAGLIKLATALVSWATVLALVPVVPKMLAMRSPDELEREIAARVQAEDALQRANAALELRVQQRTADLARSNEALQAEVEMRRRVEEELRQQGDELRQAEERMRSVVDHVIDGIITIDEGGSIQSFNPAAERLFGYPAGEVVGRNVKALMPEPYHGGHDAYLADYLRTGQAKVIGIGREVVGRRKDGSTFAMDLAVSEFRLGQRRFFTGIVRDITERKRLEQELRQRVQELAEADRKKDEFLATLAHELRNPLAPLRTALQLLQVPGAGAAVAGRAREIMGRQVEQMVRLVDDLLDVSRIMQGKIELRRERVELAAVVARGVEMARPVIDAHRHELTVSLPPEPVWLEADVIRLAQVVSNLLTNAAKYTEDGGHIWLNAGREGTGVAVRVRDTGVGIEPAVLPQLFGLFVQADRTLGRSQGGMGVGLALVRRLVEMHGGSVEASSDGPGRGSEFVMHLPTSARSRQGDASGSAGAEAPPDPASRLCILVVDDNRDAADSLALVLRLEGHDVRVTYDGQTALEVAQGHPPDLALVDLGMPGMDGYELCRRLRAQPALAGALLVALTGWGQEEDRRRSEEAGFDRHLIKPVEPQSLHRLLTHPRLAGP
jgi:PAS domain S-box-containing protein